MMTPLEAELFDIVFMLNMRKVLAYGVLINDELTSRRGREIMAGTLYTCLQRLVDKGFLEARMTEPIPERGWRAMRLYFVTADGSNAYQEWQRKQIPDSLADFARIPAHRIHM